MQNQFLPKLTSQGVELDPSPESLGPLRDSADLGDDAGALRGRMAEDGYLFLPGTLDRGLVLKARENVTDRLAQEGLTDPAYPPARRSPGATRGSGSSPTSPTTTSRCTASSTPGP